MGKDSLHTLTLLLLPLPSIPKPAITRLLARSVRHTAICPRDRAPWANILVACFYRGEGVLEFCEILLSGSLRAL